MMSAEAIKIYGGIPLSDDGSVADRPDREVDRLVRAYQVAHNVNYETAFERVCADPANEHVLKSYARS